MVHSCFVIIFSLCCSRERLHINVFMRFCILALIISTSIHRWARKGLPEDAEFFYMLVDLYRLKGRVLSGFQQTLGKTAH